MTPTQAEKAARFPALHAGPEIFVMPNPWDAGSARMLAGLGFAALATSSSAAAGTLGRRDYAITRDEALAGARLIVDATDLPVSADLENGFGDEPEVVAETIRRAAEVGLVGGSIEDARGGLAPYEVALAVERVAGAVEAARKLPFPFLVVARAENYLRGRPDLGDTIARLQAYERAGADVLFAPGLPDLACVRAVCAAVTKPVNVVGPMQNGAVSVAQLADAGVRRVSLATGFYRAAMAGLHDAAREVRERGTFAFATRTISSVELNKFMRE
jgi:2-methylisocitrate lyase-like PEP mutase family enzyme